MLFSFAVRAVYVESCSMFVRGGVYRIVKEALGGKFPTSIPSLPASCLPARRRPDTSIAPDIVYTVSADEPSD